MKVTLKLPFPCNTGVPAAFATPIRGSEIVVGVSSVGLRGLPLLLGSIAAAPPLLELSVVVPPLNKPVPLPTAVLLNTGGVAVFVNTFTVNVIVADAPAASVCIGVPTIRFWFVVPLNVASGVSVGLEGAAIITNVAGAGNVVAKLSVTARFVSVSVPRFLTITVNGIS